MVIDCHAHIGEGIMLHDVFQINCTPERIVRLMDKGGVDKTVIFPVSYKDYNQPNEMIARVARGNPRFIGFARVACGAPDAPEQIEYAVKELGLRGLKIHSMDGFPTRDVMGKVSELKIPMLVHAGMGTSPLMFEGLIQSYPDVQIILAHLGFELDWGKMFSGPLSAFYLARKYKNVYLDTAAATWIQYIVEQAVEEAGADKIVFGTDAPWFYPAILRASIDDLEIAEADRKKILGENMARILNL